MNSISNFQKLFHELEINGNSIGIDSLAISMTTLEEVFLKLGRNFRLKNKNLLKV